MSSVEPALHRSYLYAPGSSPAVMRKALMAGADAVVLDLEDAVASREKARAREAVADLLDEIAGSPAHIGVYARINRDGAGYQDLDLAAVVRPGLDGIRLPKAESPEALANVAARLDDLEMEAGLAARHVTLVPIVESAAGAIALTALAEATPRVTRLAFGGADLLADLGASGDDELATLHVRGELVLRSRAAGLGPPIDTVYTDLDDENGLRAEAFRARAMGFYGKSVIHPRQLAAVHDVFSPTDEEIAWAERVMASAGVAEEDGRGAVMTEGDFVDAAIVLRARGLLAIRRDA